MSIWWLVQEIGTGLLIGLGLAGIALLLWLIINPWEFIRWFTGSKP